MGGFLAWCCGRGFRRDGGKSRVVFISVNQVLVRRSVACERDGRVIAVSDRRRGCPKGRPQRQRSAAECQ